jgi:hypothetical protein
MVINDTFKKSTLALTLSASGAIGTAATTVDTCSSFNITANAIGLIFTIPNPTNLVAGDELRVSNIGTNSFTINNYIIPSGQSDTFVWNGTNWSNSVIAATNLFSTLVPIIKAKATIAVGDFLTATLQAGSVNIASTSIVAGGGTGLAIYQVNFINPLSSADYNVQMELESNPGNPNLASVIMETSTKTTTGFRFNLRETVSAAQNISIRFEITESQILTNTNTKIKQTVNAGVPVQLGNIKVQVPTTTQINGFQIGTIAGTMTASVTAQTNFAAGGWYTSQNAALALTTTFQHPFGWASVDAGDYILLTVRDNASSDLYKIEMFIGTAFTNNIIIIEKI